MRIPQILRKYVLWLLIVSVPYPLYNMVISNIIQDISPKIKTVEAAYVVLNEEKSKLGIKDKIVLQVSEDNKLKKVGVEGFCGRGNEGYVVGANMSELNRILIRHELYHLFRDGCDKFRPTIDDFLKETIEAKKDLHIRNIIPNLKYYYLEEPRANLYAWTGLRF